MTYDLTDPGLLLRPDVLDDPSAFHDVLRSDSPIWQIPGQDSYLVSDPKLIREAVGRPEDFSSNLVSLLHDDGHGCPVAFRMAPYGNPIHVLSTADPPLHTRHRKLLQSHLSPAVVADLEPAITAIVDEHLTALLASEQVDAVATFSDPVPARTICELIGLPPEDVPMIIRDVTRTGALLDGVTDLEGMSAAAHGALELTGYVEHQLEAAVGRPADERWGLLGVLADGIESGELSHDEARDMLVVLVSAGSETTASLLATAIETLARDQELQLRLRRDPEGIPDAIEAILRADGPFQFHYRWTPADTSLGGTAIPAHSRVLLMWAAANRPAPGATIETDAAPAGPVGERGPAPHFAFGRGLHFCIGAPVARLEARIALERLLAATSSIALDPAQPPTRRPSIFIRRHATLPVLVQPA
jgi:cytochrome P450